jgi:hypothetical protein
MVMAEDWDALLPQPTLSIRIDDEDLLFVVLAAVVTVESAGGACWCFRWIWQRPDLDASCELMGWDASLSRPVSERLMAGIGAFRTFSANRDRRRMSGRFRDQDDFRKAMLVAIRALRSDPMERVTQETVGSYLAGSGPRNRTTAEIDGYSPQDPGRQVRAWWTQFGMSFEELLQEA